VRRGKKFASQSGDSFTIRANEPADWKKLFVSVAEEATPERFVYLWTLDEQTGNRSEDALMGIDALLHLTHALEATMPAAKLRIDLVTRGAQPAGQSMGATAVAQAPSIGIFHP
jgi:hypothetical protein